MIEEDSSTTSGLKDYHWLFRYLKFVATPFVVRILEFVIFAAPQPALAKLSVLIIEAIETKGGNLSLGLPLIDWAIKFGLQNRVILMEKGKIV